MRTVVILPVASWLLLTFAAADVRAETAPARAPSAKRAGAPRAKPRAKVAAKPAPPGLPPAAQRGPTPGSPTLSPFPSTAPQVARVFDEQRQEQLADAEAAARAPAGDPKVGEDRWDSVLFHLQGLDSRSVPQACFWRMVAYYRRGEIARADTTRQLCELPPADQAALDAERVKAASLQPPALLPEMKAAGLNEPAASAGKPVKNPAPYTGPAPTPMQRRGQKPTNAR